MISRGIGLAILAWAVFAATVAAIREEFWSHALKASFAIAVIARRRRTLARRHRQELYR